MMCCTPASLEALMTFFAFCNSPFGSERSGETLRKTPWQPVAAATIEGMSENVPVNISTFADFSDKALGVEGSRTSACTLCPAERSEVVTAPP